MKVSIIGAAGRVGSSIAHALILTNNNIKELVLKDIVDQIHGEALDLTHAASALNRNLKIIATKESSEPCHNSDLVIIAAGIPLSKAGTNDRNALLEKNRFILDSIMDEMPDNGHTKYIIITNPIDVMAHHLAQKIGDRKRVLGVSTLTDTVRLNTLTSGYLIGEHSGTMVHVGGDIDVSQVTKLGLDVVNAKGGTWFTTSSVVAKVANAVLNDEQKEMPIAVQLNGEYGMENTCLSVPCRVGKDGVTICNIELSEKKLSKLQEAGNSVREKLSFK